MIMTSCNKHSAFPIRSAYVTGTCATRACIEELKEKTVLVTEAGHFWSIVHYLLAQPPLLLLMYGSYSFEAAGLRGAGTA